MGILDRLFKNNQNKENPTKEIITATNNNEKYKALYEDYINLAKEVKEKYEKAGIECNIELPKSLDDYAKDFDYFNEVAQDLIKLKYEALEQKSNGKELNSPKEEQIKTASVTKSSGLPSTSNLSSNSYKYDSSLGKSVDSFYDGAHLNEKNQKAVSDYIVKGNNEFDEMMAYFNELEEYNKEKKSGRSK